MAHIDLHLHSTFSDGVLSPEEVVATAAARGVTLLAITDHDNVGGVAIAREAGQSLGVQVISGVEINTEVGREEVHILGYGFPEDSPVLLAGLQQRREARVQRMQQMVSRLVAIGYPLDFARVQAIAGQGSIGRPHLAQALVDAGYVQSGVEAFERLIGNRCPAYVPRLPFAPEQAIELVHQAGGIVSLAHPGKLGDPIRFIRRLKTAGLDALEAYHSDHSPSTTERMVQWARQYHLEVTGGTDSHGPRGPRMRQIGDVPIPDAVGARLLELLTSRGRH